MTTENQLTLIAFIILGLAVLIYVLMSIIKHSGRLSHIDAHNERAIQQCIELNEWEKLNNIKQTPAPRVKRVGGGYIKLIPHDNQVKHFANKH